MSIMNPLRNYADKTKSDYAVKFFSAEFIICAVLLAVCFAVFKLAPDAFAHIRESFSELTEKGFTIPEIGNFLTQAAESVMEYLGIAQTGNA